MYMLDCEVWNASFSPALNAARRLLLACASVGAAVGTVFRVEDYSYGPLCVFLVRASSAAFTFCLAFTFPLATVLSFSLLAYHILRCL